MARTFQNIRLFHNMSAVENVQVAMHSRLKGGVWASIIRTPRLKREEEAAEARARELLAFCGLAARQFDEYAKNLPYGDQRRLEVARAPPPSPSPASDEPTAGMNPQETADFIEFVRRPVTSKTDRAAHRARHEGRHGVPTGSASRLRGRSAKDACRGPHDP
jgi:branched-chain amino acid transport system ATP-binding protein